MSDLLTALYWSRADDAPARERAARAAFLWPTPPLARYAPPAPQTDPLPCEVLGRNDRRVHGRMTFFVPEESVAHVQVPPARTTLPLRFDQFRALTLTTPLLPVALPADDPHAELLAAEPRTPYSIALEGGGELQGETLAHVETAFGLFLFPPAPGDVGVLRMFVPRVVYRALRLGPRIGEVLLEQERVSASRLEEAVQAQRTLRQRKLGDLLLERRVVTQEQLIDALDHQAKMPMVRIGEALRSLDMITEEQLAGALREQDADRSAPLGEILVRMKAVTRDDLRVALARKMGYPLVDVDVFPIEAEALRRLSLEIAQRLQVIPLLVRDGRLVVAMDDPVGRRGVVEEVEFCADMKAIPVVAHVRSIDEALRGAYERIGAAPARFPVETELISIPEQDLSTDQLVESLERAGPSVQTETDDRPIEQSDNSLVRLINNMIVEAIRDGASDIHIESYPGREKIRIRFRKDGLMRTYLELPHNYRGAVIGRIKVMCDLDIAERRKPQDGKINFAKFSPQHRVELRVATIPTANGLEDVVMRLLTSARPIPMDRLGLAAPNLARLTAAIERPYGLVLCVGPTGSGKTTTLHSALSHINVPERKIWTAEDPIEITQPGLRQVQVNPRIEWTFAKALRAFLRADPDVIMIGEVRDGETAQIAIEASLTGHLVLSTLHTNSAPETVTRLLDMGMDPFNFADALLAVLAQRLVRRLCDGCRSARDATAAEIDELVADYLAAFADPDARPAPDALLAQWRQQHGREGRLVRYACAGCDGCAGTGFKGRAGIHELMVVDRELRHLIQTGRRADELQRAALAGGMRTLRQDGIEKVLSGVTTIEEVRATSNV